MVLGSEADSQLSSTPTIDNYPAFLGGLGGVDLVKTVRTQARIFGATFAQVPPPLTPPLCPLTRV